ncbi:MAG: hypothetical protein EBR15_04510, partial [Gammaproteobacteria bacterium]|nr:hypothetical protein [Gammaproteobacteria bacterium]
DVVGTTNIVGATNINTTGGATTTIGGTAGDTAVTLTGSTTQNGGIYMTNIASGSGTTNDHVLMIDPATGRVKRAIAATVLTAGRGWTIGGNQPDSIIQSQCNQSPYIGLILGTTPGSPCTIGWDSPTSLGFKVGGKVAVRINYIANDVNNYVLETYKPIRVAGMRIGPYCGFPADPDQCVGSINIGQPTAPPAPTWPNAWSVTIGGGNQVSTGLVGQKTTLLGWDSFALAGGSGNVGLGFEAGYNEKNDNKLYIANTRARNLIFGDFATGRVGINTATGLDSNNLTTYTNAPNANLQVNAFAATDKVLIVKGAASQTGNLFEAQDSAGSALAYITSTGAVWGTGAFNQLSDARLKTNVEVIRNALQIVRKLQGVRFDWNAAAYPDRSFTPGRQIGLIAQEVERVVPEVVSENVDGFKGVAYANLVPLLIEGMKEQDAAINAQDARIAMAERQLAAVEERLTKGEKQLLAHEDRIAKAESFVKLFDRDSTADTLIVLTPTFKAQNLTAERAEIAELYAKRIEAEKARFVELDADGATVENFAASKLSGRVMNTGRKEIFVSYGAFVQLFDVPANAHFTIMVSSEDGSYASAQVINAGGVLRVIPNGGEGIDVVARGKAVGLVAASKKVTASWTRTG